MKDTCKKALKNAVLYNSDENTINHFCESSCIKNFKKGEIIFFDKDVVNQLMIIISGKVSVYKVTQQYDEKVIFILKEKDILNEEILLYDEVSTSCEAIENTKVLCIEKDKFIKEMKVDFELMQCVLKSNVKKTQRLYRQVKNNSTVVKTEKKIVSKLWKLANDYGVQCDKGIKIELDLSVTYLAKMIGAKRETTSRIVKQLINQNFICIEDSYFIITNKDELSKFFYKE